MARGHGGRQPGKLLEQNYLVLNLNDPCALPDTSWIKPGKVIREVTLTTAGGKACVDFCVQQGCNTSSSTPAGTAEGDPRSDAREVSHPKRNPDPKSLDLQEVIEYGNSKGIGVILYVNQRALERQLDEILPLYEKWGVKGVKFGFVNVGSQRWTRWLHEAIRKAAEHRLMVDIHDEFRNTGYQRTYPNLMTVEGILGNEGFPTPVHNATLPFTRFLTGPADYTFCWYSGKLQPTHAHQLAISTIYFSPWQFLYWYDRPGDVQGRAGVGLLEGPADDLGRNPRARRARSASARRSRGCKGRSGMWARSVLEAGRWKSRWPFSTRERSTLPRSIPTANPEQPSSKEVKIETRAVDSTTCSRANMPANGGHAVRIVPRRPRSPRGGGATPFVHPGPAALARRDLDRMKQLVAEGAEPWKSGFEKLRDDPQSQADWRLRGPFAAVSRGPHESRHIGALDADANAAYQNAPDVVHYRQRGARQKGGRDPQRLVGHAAGGHRLGPATCGVAGRIQVRQCGRDHAAHVSRLAARGRRAVPADVAATSSIRPSRTSPLSPTATGTPAASRR